MEADFCDDEDLLDCSCEEFRVYDEECIENKTPLILPENEGCSEKEEQEEDEKLLDEESKNVEDLFEIEEVIGDKFMAIKPWRGAIFRPTHYNEPNPDKPDERYKLEYVFGYRAEDSRNNVFYNKEGNIVYMTACLGVILNKRTNDQTFFGGIEVEHHEKQSARDLFNHTNDIMAMEVSNDRKIACSGQNGSQPSCFIWDAITGEVYRRFILPKGARGVVAIGFSEDNAYVATIDNSDDHVVRVFDVQTSKLIFEQKTGGNQVFDLEWSRKPGHYEFATCGVKHFIVFKPLENIGKSGVSGSKGEMSSHACVTYDENGTCFSGCSDSRIYCWRNRQLMKAYQVHAEGFVGAIKVFGDRIFSGGKDGFIVVSDPNTGKVERKVQVGALVRAIDFMDGNILVGDREGTIFEIDEHNQITYYMCSHSDGEAWGLALTDDGKIISSGDDNKVMVWSIEERRLLAQAIVSDQNKKARKGGVSSLTKYPPSKCARAVAINEVNGHVAVASNTGVVSIRESIHDIEVEIASKHNSSEWIQVLKYSPCGYMLACGSHDNNIYIYDVDRHYALRYKLRGHNSYVVSVDWSADCSTIRSVCGAYELLFFNIATGKQVTGGGSATVDTIWATNSAKFGWCVDGIFPMYADGTHINDVDWSIDGSVIATSDDYGLLNIYRNPARKGHQPRCYRAHSEHVVRAKFTHDASRIISIGGHDKTIMIWKRDTSKYIAPSYKENFIQ